jgi:hypothetical protein
MRERSKGESRNANFGVRVRRRRCCCQGRERDLRAVASEGDILGHGWISATLKVRKVVRGAIVPSVLPVVYFAHTYLREDRDLMLGLTRTDDGGYVITTSQVMAFSILTKYFERESLKGVAAPQ